MTESISGRILAGEAPGKVPLGDPIPRSALTGRAPEIAPTLLGLLLIHDTPAGLVGGLIVEVEAYDGPRDQASHARVGLTDRTRPMFGPAGHAYVYQIYGLHRCMNVVVGPTGEASAVLIRALAPIVGLELIRERRRRPLDPAHRLAAGPARLCQALDVSRAANDADLLGSGPLQLRDPGPDRRAELLTPGIVIGPRVGVDYAGAWATRPWRFGIRDHPALSRPFRSVPSA